MLVAKRPLLIDSDRANNDASNHLEKLLRLTEDQTENEYFSDRADK